MSTYGSQSSPSHSSRPTLPSLHSLGLPQLISFSSDRMSICDGQKTPTGPLNEHTTWHRARQSSISSVASSCTITSARSPSPPNSDSDESECSERSRISISPPLVSHTSNSYRLVRSTTKEANAYVLVPPAPEHYVENISSFSRAKAARSPKPQNQALLLVGPALEYLRHPRVRIAKGARLHPYRMVPRPERRSGTSTPSDPRS